MERGQFREQRFAFFRKPHFDLTPVLRTHSAAYEVEFFASRYERHDAMVLSL